MQCLWKMDGCEYYGTSEGTHEPVFYGNKHNTADYWKYCSNNRWLQVLP